jgi:Ser/Thr protein kinase RdoA (MazF antagonist)
VLSGGLGAGGPVVRRGVAVRRPAPANAPAIHQFLRDLRAAGFAGAPTPRRLSDEGWEELEFVQGEVPVSPHPWWSMGDDALASVGRLLRRFHDAAARVPVDRSAPWSGALADPEGGPIICHDDVCFPNVVFRDRSAAALIDFDFAAPGRPVWDLAMTARYWVPLRDPASAAVSGLDHLDPFRRLRVLVDAYGLGAPERARLVPVLEDATAVCRSFVAERVGAGDAGFVAAFDEHGGWERWDRLQSWLVANRNRFTEAVTRP